MVSCHAKIRMPSLPLAGLFTVDTLVEGRECPLPSVQSLYYVELKSSLRTRLAR